MRATAVAFAAVSLAGCAPPNTPARAMLGADPARGLAAIKAEGCASCHDIPGVRWPKGQAAGALAGFANRSLIGGALPNQPDVLVGWLRDAPALLPQTAMPPSTLTEGEARDAAAYLYTLK